ncbi:MAG: glycosyltransferase [Lachnospiraceae bacterium]|nr:glycosyltransferase [Lachnospiraceae bacterium]
MKLLSIAVPCYNSAEYMDKCIKSLLKGGEEVEILIVDDGSVKDNTAEIADRYAAKYPSIVKAIHQENAGHGGAVNTGLANATGLYFKVVDSDDRVSAGPYMKILSVLRDMAAAENPVDMVLSNFVYDKVDVKHKMVMRYGRILPKDRVFTWDEIGSFKPGQYLLMHSIIYRTQILRDCGLELPRHTFYVDNIFAFQPFASVRTMYYVNENFYWYYIGREDQSVNEKIMISRIDQQLRVNRIMIDSYTKEQISSKKLKKYMRSYLTIITCVSSILAIRSNTPENLQKKAEIWAYLKEKNPKTWRRIRFSLLGIVMNLPGRTGRKIASLGYAAAQKIYGFN